MGLPFPAKMAAIRGVFTAMFDAVETMGEFDEDRWIDLIAAFNATGRLVFGWPHLESSEADVFAALDDIAVDLQTAKEDIGKTTADARVILAELREAIGFPDAETPEPPSAPEPEPAPLPEPTATATTEPEPEAAEVVAAPSRVDPGADEPVPVSAEGHAGAPQTPSSEDERMFEVVRQLGEAATYAAIERALGMQPSRAYARFALLAGYNTLPEDMVAFRESRKGKARPLAVVPDDGWEPLCMDAADFDAWKAHNSTLRRVMGAKRVAKRPCADCPLSYAVEMRASGKCNGEPGLAA